MVKYHKLSISVDDEEYHRLQELKEILKEKTYSKVIRRLINYGKL